MRSHLTILVTLVASVVVLSGCAALPYQRTTEASAVGATAGAVAGALLAGEEDEVLGGIIGGVLGAAAGYVIGAKTSWFSDGNEQQFDQAVNQAKANPATVQDVYQSSDADLNNDGLITKDELVALANSKLTPDEVINRLQATNQVFHVTYAQRQALLDAGVDPQVVYELEEINQT